MLTLALGALLLLPQSALADSLPVPKIQAPNLLHLSRGRETASQIDVSLDRRFHIQTNPASRKNMIPTVLEIDAPPAISVRSVSYPDGTPFHMGQTDLSVYQGDFGIRFALGAKADAKRGKQLVHAKLKYQACDEKACFRPSEVPFDFWVEIQ